jgi:hypothetical protein
MTHVIFTAHMHSKVKAINLHKMEAKIWPYFRSTRSNSKKVSRTEVQQKQQKSIFWVSCLTHMEKRRSENIKKPWKNQQRKHSKFRVILQNRGLWERAFSARDFVLKWLRNFKIHFLHLLTKFSLSIFPLHFVHLSFCLRDILTTRLRWIMGGWAISYEFICIYDICI